jgi:hypothetical protein
MDDLQLSLRPFLKKHGFRLQARTCNRTTADGLTHVVNFQMSRFDSPGTSYFPWLRKNLYGKFTVNVGVYVPEVGLAEYGAQSRTFVPEVYCCIRMRLGQLGGKSDVWWSLPGNKATIQDIQVRIERDAFPFLARCENRDGVLQELALGTGTLTPRISRAIILAHRGEFDDARELLRNQINATPSAKHCEYVQQIAERLNLGPSHHGTSKGPKFTNRLPHLRPSHLQRLRQNPRLPHHRYKIRIRHPSWQNVHVNMPGDTRPGSLTDVHS